MELTERQLIEAIHEARAVARATLRQAHIIVNPARFGFYPDPWKVVTELKASDTVLIRGIEPVRQAASLNPFSDPDEATAHECNQFLHRVMELVNYREDGTERDHDAKGMMFRALATAVRSTSQP